LADGVAGLAENWDLAGELFEDLGGLLETIARLTGANVEDELGYADFPVK
jgi:hypothetical protein